MKKQTAVFFLAFIVVFSGVAAQAQKSKGSGYACTTPNAESLCRAAITCGAASAPCTGAIKKDGGGASVTPDIAGAKSNKLFCVKAGTKMNFEAKNKSTGFVLDFGPKTPFDKEGSIVGGCSKPDSATAKNPGCYRFSAGACVSGAIYGMCGSQMVEMVVTK
jgi:hypothetical protein